MVDQHIAPVVLIVGTRPEGIKMAPVYHALKRAGVPVLICSTMQHDQLLTEVLDLFGIVPDAALHIMRQGQDLFYLTQAVLQKTKDFFRATKPSLILVQGDTTSSMAACLAAFYLGIPVGHVEAGLRTDDVGLPFPEEMNRRVISMVAAYHFAPTPAAVANILAHGVHRDSVFCTGNTVVDALYSVREKIQTKEITIRADIQECIERARSNNHPIALLTVHRRESFHGGLMRILQTVKTYAQEHPDIVWIYPYHPNPRVIEAIQNVGLLDMEHFHIVEPLGYKDLVYVLDASTMVLTDSGGIQEEAVSLSKPVVVLREKTERMEGVLAGCARVVGHDPMAICAGIEWALSYRMDTTQQLTHIYGDGHAAERIVAFIQARNEKPIMKEASSDVVACQREHKSEKKDENVKKVCVIGLGYIGLPTAIIAAESGYYVTGFDIDEKRVALINKGDPIIHEPEAYEKLQFVLGTQQFHAATSIESADYYVVAVPTPIKEDKTANLDYLFDAVASIASVIKQGDTIIIESTIPVGSSQKVARFIEEKTNLKAGEDFFVAHCPERVLPGNIFYELVANDRVIGGIDTVSVTHAKQFYKPFVSGRLYLTTVEIAEMVKLIENSSRDAQLAFAHQVSSMAQSLGLNPYEVIALANKHPRVNILQPTCGVGGHCIAVDPWFLIESFPNHTKFIKAAREINDAKPYEVITQIEVVADAWREMHEKPPIVLLMGLTYKPNVEDLRESPALLIARSLIKNQNISLFVSDPHADSVALEKELQERIVRTADGLERADIVVFLVGHDRFKVIDHKLLSHKKLLDFCGMFYTPKSETGDEQTYWPARSVMDFFIANQSHEDVDAV